MRRGRVVFAALALAALVGGGVANTSAEAKPVPVPKRDVSASRGEDLRHLVRKDYRPGMFAATGEITAIVQFNGGAIADLQDAARARGARFNQASATRLLSARQDRVIARFAGVGATMTGRYQLVVNGAKVRIDAKNVAKLAALPGVKSVEPVHKVYRDYAKSNAATGVPVAWDDLGYTGAGVKVGIIDTGIDYYHLDFGGLGAAAFAADDGLDLSDGNFPTVKVAGGYDFAGDDYDADGDFPDNIPVPDPDPLDCNGHGTHVAGTAAGQGVTTGDATYTGPYDSSLNPADFKVFPGAAPEATLYAYRVFGCDGSADNSVIIDAIEMAVADGVDVVNLSLGSPFGTGADVDEVALNNAAKLGTLPVASAGNEGPGAYIVGGPGTAARALSVAAADFSVASYDGVVVKSTTYLVDDVAVVSLNDVPVTTTISGPVLYVGLGCDESSYGDGSPDMLDPAYGKVVVAQRGTCDRIARAIFGQKYGALAVILINNSSGFPPYEGHIAGTCPPDGNGCSGVSPDVTIPFLGADEDAGIYDGDTVDIDPGGVIPNPSYEATAPFSSNGPRNGDSFQKPEVSAPGVSVYSAGVGTGTDAVAISGTSMASPHTAGIAALVVQAHPTWTTQQLKAVIQATSNPGGLTDFDSRRNGAGLVDAREAVDSVAYATTTDFMNTANFGFNPIGVTHQEGVKLTYTNTGSTDITYDLFVDYSSYPWGTVSVSPSKVKVPKGKSVSVTVKLLVTQAQNVALPQVSYNGYESDWGSLTTLNGIIRAEPTAPGPGVYTLNTPFMFVPKGLSDIDPRSNVVRIKGGAGSVVLHNKGQHEGLVDLYASALSDSANDILPSSHLPNLLEVGVQSLPLYFEDEGQEEEPILFDTVMYFAINLNEHVSTQSVHEYVIWIDTDFDMVADKLIDVADSGLITAGTPNGRMGALVVDLNTFGIIWFYDNVSAPANSSVLSIPAWAAYDLGLDLSGPGLFRFTVEGYSVVSTTAGVEYVPGKELNVWTGLNEKWATWGAHQPLLSSGDFYIIPGQKSVTQPLYVDTSQWNVQTPRGWLLINNDDLHGVKSGQLINIIGTPT